MPNPIVNTAFPNQIGSTNQFVWELPASFAFDAGTMCNVEIDFEFEFVTANVDLEFSAGMYYSANSTTNPACIPPISTQNFTPSATQSCNFQGPSYFGFNYPYICIACDPNSLHVDPIGCGENGLLSPQPLNYKIQFENIGKGPAHDVVIWDTLDPAMDTNSVAVISASHSWTLQRNGYILQFNFNGIELPSNIANPGNGVGEITFLVSPKPSLPEGTVVLNSATIRFDDMPFVPTNSVKNTFVSNPYPIVEIGPDKLVDPSIPALACAQLQPSVSGSLPPYVFSWSTGSSQTQINVCPPVTTTYYLDVDAAGGCLGRDSLVVQTDSLACGKGSKMKVTICEPRGSKGKWKTKCVGLSKLQSALSKGAVLGACPSMKSGEDSEGLMEELEVTPLPNPFRNYLDLRVIGGQGTLEVEIFSIGGQLLWSALILEGGDVARVMTDSWSPGMYFYRVSDCLGNTANGKVIKSE